MFEKEAEEYTTNKMVDLEDFDNYDSAYYRYENGVQDAFIEAAEFGYNKANDWHLIKDGDLPKKVGVLYSVLVYSWDFNLSRFYEKYGHYIPTVCEWNGESFEALDKDAYYNAKNINNCKAWKEIILPEFPKE